MRLVAQVREVLGVELPLRTLLDVQTNIERLAATLDAQLAFESVELENAMEAVRRSVAQMSDEEVLQRLHSLQEQRP
jgi:hypothetical protein